ncbi:MAG: hypothetical protein IT223_12830 [Crocinitomicaceae bacterium]|nr:hypothetical protein [Crocinitomicaceae bacterium]
MMKILRQCLFSVFFLLLACSHPDDIAPVIESVSINGVEGNHFLLNTGMSSAIAAKVSDDVLLSQVRIELKNSSGYGTPDGQSRLFTFPVKGNWNNVSVKEISGQSTTVNYSFLPADSVAGKGTLEVGIVDGNGNLSTKSYSLFLQNELLPAFNIISTFPPVNSENELTVPLNGNLSIDGIVSDTDGLSELTVLVKRGSVVFFESSILPAATNFNLNNIAIPSFTEAGSYTIEISAKDTFSGFYSTRASFRVE